MAISISYVLKPIIKRLEKNKIPCGNAILIVYFVIAAVMATVVIFVVPEFINNSRELMNTLPEIGNKYQGFFKTAISYIEANKWSPDLKRTIHAEIQNGLLFAQNKIFEMLKNIAISFFKVLTIFFDLILAMIIAYYFVKDADFLKNVILDFIPKKWRNSTISCGREINAVLERFVNGQLITALIVGIIETLGLIIINVKYPLVLGLIAGVANIIPYFGPIIGGIPAIAVALIDSPIKALWTIIMFIVVQQIDNAVISPNIIEGKLGIHPVMTIFAVLAGGEFFGIIGMLVAVPLAAIIKIILKRLVEAMV